MMLLVRYRWLLGLLLVQAAGCTSTYWRDAQPYDFQQYGVGVAEKAEDLRQCKRDVAVADKSSTEVDACMRALGYSVKSKCWFDPPIWDDNCRD